MTAEERRNRVHRRTCGDATTGHCNLCCKLLPVQGLHAASQWCQHAVKGKGCGIYAERPGACRTWACVWLADPEKADHYGLRRPDKSHYVIDEAADLITVNGRQVACLQVWLDPGYPAAWRADAGLKRLIEDLAQSGVATILRLGDQRGRVILAPPLAPEWIEHESQSTRGETTTEEKLAFFGDASLDAAARASIVRSKHIESARRRALDYLDQGQVNEAVNDFVSELNQHADTGLSAAVQGRLMRWLIDGDVAAIRRFILETH